MIKIATPKDMSDRIFDAAWGAVLDEDKLIGARHKLSIHELRMIIAVIVSATATMAAKEMLASLKGESDDPST